MLFPPAKRGIPMGIWATATPVGGFIAGTLLPVLELSIGWRGVWWVSAAFVLVTLMLFWLLVRTTPKATGAGDPAPDVSMPRVLSNQSVWLLGLAMLGFGLGAISITMLYPTFLNTELGMPLTTAGLMIGISSLTIIPGAPLAGWVSDKFKTRKWVIFAGFLIFIPFVAIIFRVPKSMVIPAMILFGICISILLSLINTAAPEIAGGPKAVPMSLAVVAAFQNLSNMIGPPLLGGLVDNLGWVPAGYILAAAPVMGLVAVLLNKKLR